MGVIFILFAIAIGTATFIESRYGSTTASATVYNAWWFILLLFVGALNLIANIFTKNLHQKGKRSLFILHISFVFILIGAAITHFFGFEGYMHIRQGETSNVIISTQTYLIATATEKGETVSTEMAIKNSEFSQNNHTLQLNIHDKTIQINCTQITSNAVEQIIADRNGKPMFNMVIADQNGPQKIVLDHEAPKYIGGIAFALNDTSNQKGVTIFTDNDTLAIKAPFDITATEMMTQKQHILRAGQKNRFALRTLYTCNGLQVVAKDYIAHGRKAIIKSTEPSTESSQDEIKLTVSSGNDSKTSVFLAQHNTVNDPVQFKFNDLTVSFYYGAKVVYLPFSLGLVKFSLTRYPGSSSPSSYESLLFLNDSAHNVKEQHKVFMNSVLNYNGFRFFQSSFDTDEMGTILSVNHDYWGTMITYLGYILLGIGIVFSLVNKKSRFRMLSGKLQTLKEARKILSVIVILIVSATIGTKELQAQNPIPQSLIIDRDKASQCGEIVVQDNGGRLKPLNTLTSELVRKISRQSQFEGQSPDQIFWGMMLYPQLWENVPFIKVTDTEIKKILSIKGSYASFKDFLTSSNQQETYKLQQHVDDAFKKKPASRTKFDTEVLRVDERVNLCYMIFIGDFLHIFPVAGNSNKNWNTVKDQPPVFIVGNRTFNTNEISAFLMNRTLSNSTATNNKTNIIDAIKEYQRHTAETIMPSTGKIKAEILYNKAEIFDRLGAYYGIIGSLLLILQFIAIFRPKLHLNKIIRIANILIVIGFVFHLSGLLLRWYIAGHAPWSNAYESLVYIAFATMLAGLLFSRKSTIALSTTAILAWLILFVAHLNWMDPEVSNLVPVLKSYWLLIHVAVITASYGFLGLGALLALINLFIMIMQSRKNIATTNLIIEELSIIIEMTLIVGLYALSIGTFLGGVWANESWGRYWGWDAKETWALVSVLVYGFITHLRLIPGLKGVFIFNLMALLGISSVIMTYFGVNYYLAGLHSYAKGEANGFPIGGYIAITIVTILAVWAGIRFKMLNTIKQ